MKLTPEQREQFDRDGYLFFPSLFSPQETQNLLDAVPARTSGATLSTCGKKGVMRCAPTLPRTW